MKQRFGHFRKFQFGRVFEFGSLELMSKDLIVEIKVPLALHEDGTGCGVEVINGIDEPDAERLLKRRKAVGLTGIPTFFNV